MPLSLVQKIRTPDSRTTFPSSLRLPFADVCNYFSLFVILNTMKHLATQMRREIHFTRFNQLTLWQRSFLRRDDNRFVASAQYGCETNEIPGRWRTSNQSQQSDAVWICSWIAEFVHTYPRAVCQTSLWRKQSVTCK